MSKIIPTTPTMIATMLDISADGCGGGAVADDCEEHSSSLGDDMATGHCESTVSSSPFITILGLPLLTKFSIREIRKRLSACEVPCSLARYVTYDGEPGKHVTFSLSMVSLVMPHCGHEAVIWFSMALLMSAIFSSVDFSCIINFANEHWKCYNNYYVGMVW